MSKTHRLRFISLMVIVLMVLSLSAVTAQDSSNQQPLLQMLANVPDNAVSRSQIVFNDRKAIEAAFPPAKMPSNWAEFKAARDDKGATESFNPVDIWWGVLRNQQSAETIRYMDFSDDTAKAVGFDFFAIEQELNYGQPPQQTLQLGGHFDLDKVHAALKGQGYSQQDQSGVEVWCPSNGCDGGAEMNLDDRNPANPFGGELGRKWPIVIQENNLIGSPDLTVIQNHVAVKAGTGKSLADAPEYQAAVAALAQNGALMQAYFWDGDILASMSQLDPTLIAANSEVRKKLIESILKDYEPLPVYKLLSLGDVANDTQMAGEVALVYTNKDDADKAAEIIPKRIDTYTSLATQQTLKDQLTDRGVTSPDIKVVESSGQYVILISFASPKASTEDILAMTSAEEGGRTDIIPPGIMFRLLMNSALRRDLGWLSTIPREVLEAAGK